MAFKSHFCPRCAQDLSFTHLAYSCLVLKHFVTTFSSALKSSILSLRPAPRIWTNFEIIFGFRPLSNLGSGWFKGILHSAISTKTVLNSIFVAAFVHSNVLPFFPLNQHSFSSVLPTHIDYAISVNFLIRTLFRFSNLSWPLESIFCIHRSVWLL